MKFSLESYFGVNFGSQNPSVTILIIPRLITSLMKMLHFKKAGLPVITITVLVIGIFCSVAALISGIWWGLVGLLPAAVIFSIREGVDIDVQKRMYRSYLSVFGVSSTQWKPIPEGTRIGIRIVKLVSRRRIGFILMDATSAGSTMELYLYTPKPERVVIKVSDSIKDLYNDAQMMRQYLGYEVIVDQRIPQSKYL